MKLRFILLLVLALTASANRAVAAAPATEILHGFVSNGSQPSQIIEGSDGNFYGFATGTIFKLTPSGDLSALYRLDLDPSSVSTLQGNPLVSGVDGNLYGTIATGGTYGGGSAFKLTLAGEFTTLRNFPADGAQSAPIAVIQASDGILYGLTRGGNNSAGTFFKVTAGGELIILRTFSSSEGSHQPILVEGADGYFYTIAGGGGSAGRGALQQLGKRGELKTIYSFGVNGDPNYYPVALALGGDGNFYVSANNVTGSSDGNICQITPSGILTVVHAFYPYGQSAPSVLVPSKSGSVYGLTRVDGLYREGTLFQINPKGDFSIVYNFRPADGLPSSIAAGRDGAFYGTATYGGLERRGTAYRISASGQFAALADFARSPDGFQPATLIQGSHGTFFGTTTYGGASGGGTVFRTTASGEAQILHAFNGGIEGAAPFKLVQSNDGSLYGLTPFVFNIDLNRQATLFRLTPDGSFQTLHTFDGGANGYGPNALIKGNDANIYGTVSQGGAYGHGTVFKLDPSGDLVTLYSFTGGSDGSSPGLLIQGRDGNLYGIASGAGGSFFKLTPSGTFTILAQGSPYTFATTLVEGTDGNFYGTTPTIRYPVNFSPPTLPPTLFQVTPGGASKIFPLYFDPTTLVAGRDGRLYGTTLTHVFSATPSGDITVLHNFDLQSEGSNATALLQGADGNYYGTMASAGPAGGGTIFQFLLRRLPRPMNLSTRVNVQGGDNVLIGGFIITGSDPKKVIIRGIGPSLTSFNGALQNPTLELHQGNMTIATNDNWKTRPDGSSQQAEVEATTIPPAN